MLHLFSFFVVVVVVVDNIFFCQGYELSGEIALKNNHYYYYYYCFIVLKSCINLCVSINEAI